MRGEDGGEVHRARPLRAVETPHGLDGVRVHVHGLAAVAPAGSDGDGDGDALPGELLCAGGGFGDAADGGVGDDARDGGAVGVAEAAGKEGGDAARHAHGLVFKGFADAVHAAVDGRADADLGVLVHSISVTCCRFIPKDRDNLAEIQFVYPANYTYICGIKNLIEI